MRACPHCQHENADHLGYCARCGKRIGARTGMTPPPVLTGGLAPIPGAAPAPASGPVTAAATVATTAPTVVMPATPPAGGIAMTAATAAMPLPPTAGGAPAAAQAVTASGPAAARLSASGMEAAPTVPMTATALPGATASASGLAAAAPDLDATSPAGPVAMLVGSVGYVFDFIRSQLDAKARLARLEAERIGDERLLAGALVELGEAVRTSGVTTPALAEVLASMATAEVRKSTAERALAEIERIRVAEDGRLAADESAREAEWRAADAAAGEAEQIVRGVHDEREGVIAALARILESGKTLEAEAGARIAGAATQDAAAQAEARTLAEGLRRQAAALAPEQKALEQQAGALEIKLGDLKDKAETRRAAAQEFRLKYDKAAAARIKAAQEAAAAAANHVRERAEAERELTRLTVEVGRTAAKTRPFAPGLEAPYARVDNLQQAIDAHVRESALIREARGRYDRKRLYTGIGILTGGLVLLVVVLRAFL